MGSRLDNKTTQATGEGWGVHFVPNMLPLSSVCSARIRNTWTASPRGNCSTGSRGLRILWANFLTSDYGVVIIISESSFPQLSQSATYCRFAICKRGRHNWLFLLSSLVSKDACVLITFNANMGWYPLSQDFRG